MTGEDHIPDLGGCEARVVIPEPFHDVLQETVAPPGLPENPEIRVARKSLARGIAHRRGHQQRILAGRIEIFSELHIIVLTRPVIL